MEAVALSYIERTNPASSVRLAEKVIASPLRYPPVVLALSVSMILRWEENENRAIDRPRFFGLLNDVVKRLQLEPSDATKAMAYQAAASGFEIIGDMPEALRCIDEGLKLLPNSEDLLVFKGLLLYGSQTDQAAQAFDKLIQRETPNV